jgi:hypothetical protein
MGIIICFFADEHPSIHAFTYLLSCSRNDLRQFADEVLSLKVKKRGVHVSYLDLELRSLFPHTMIPIVTFKSIPTTTCLNSYS